MRRTVIVQGRLALATRRAAAARAGENGLQIMTVTQLAARLAGGFLHQVTGEELELAIARALDAGGFEDIESVRHLPGMTRAVVRTLKAAWNADFRLDAATDGRARMRDLALIEARVRDLLPAGARLPATLRDEACARMRWASALLGTLSIEGIHFVEPVWRPLIHELCAMGPVVWTASPGADTAWFRGEVKTVAGVTAEPLQVTCADPRHEVLEAFRWARGLIVSGQAGPGDIAVCGVATDEWDDHVLALVAETGLPVWFPHGRPCLATADGQRCAALADVLLHGLNQARVRRLLALVTGQGTMLDELPTDWLRVPRNASLTTAAEWKQALDRMPMLDADPRPVVMPLLRLLERGTAAAEEAADAFLRGRARRLWDRATRAAPAAAVELSLRTIRVEDERDASDSIVWTAAWQLAAAPRPWVRLLGLTERGWPSSSGEDPLLPEHIVESGAPDADPPAEADRRAFNIIAAGAGRGIILSRSRRNAQGGRTGPSPLLSPGGRTTALARTRLAEHAASESDRLTARPQDVAEHPATGAALRCWHNWHRKDLTVHDGLVSAGHAVIAGSLAALQSPTSLTRLLRDPLGFVWKYALGWRAPEDRERPLTLPPDEFGRLVHELLRRSVDALEPAPGFTVAHPEEIAEALDAAAGHVTATWPLERPVPPEVLWVNTVRQASAMALAGLTGERFTESGTRSWTEVPFGDPAPPEQTNPGWPWDPALRVTVPGTAVAIRGKIDRLDLRAGAVAVRVTDYKTGQQPADAATTLIAGGSELQRVLYGLACRQLLPETPAIRTRLIYLKDEPAIFFLSDLDGGIAQVADFVNTACNALQRGHAIPGPAAEDRFNDLRLALPASPAYFRRKQAAFQASAGDLAGFWALP
ncbi:MAG: PD-(D/E)XK nuclease family protein [Mesorhizobium sp.]|nr:MAG: PD-(D/E)XK nuclease family protein [Mesorhizobium sp.]